jgi:protein-S-isoprenylcysteine O-methyltransferase Ste14
MLSSPWWYRQRALCIGALYFAGFYAAFFLARLVHRPGIPTYIIFGDAWEHPILWGAVVLALIGWALRAWGTSYLQVAVVWNHDAVTDHLYVAGPFRFTRNPLYLGNLFQAAAFALFAPPVGWWFIVFLQWLFLTALMHVEERGMRARYGEAFDAYCAQVPQLLPRLTPAKGEDVAHGSFLRALMSETMSLGFAIALAAYAIFGASAWGPAWIIASAGAVFQYAVRWRESTASR